MRRLLTHGSWRSAPRVLFPYPTRATWLWLRYRQWRGRPLLVDAALDCFCGARVRHLAHLALTEHMMTLAGGQYLRLGRELAC